jgi:hypothetical protein
MSAVKSGAGVATGRGISEATAYVSAHALGTSFRAAAAAACASGYTTKSCEAITILNYIKSKRIESNLI